MTLATKEEAESLFTKFDVKKDGKLDLKEFKEMVKSDCKIEEACQTLLIFLIKCPNIEALKRIYVNKDGKIFPKQLKALGDRFGLKHSYEKYINFLCAANPPPFQYPEIGISRFCKYATVTHDWQKEKNFEAKMVEPNIQPWKVAKDVRMDEAKILFVDSSIRAIDACTTLETLLQL